MKNNVVRNIANNDSSYRKRLRKEKKRKEMARIKRVRNYLLVYGLFGCLLVYVSINFFKIMIFDSEDIATRSLKHGVRDKVITPERGKIKDRNGFALAENYKVYRLEVDIRTMHANARVEVPKMEDDMTDEEKNAIIEEKAQKQDEVVKEAILDIARILDVDGEKLQKRLMTKGEDGKYIQGTILARKVPGNKVEEIKGLCKSRNLLGMMYMDDAIRVYDYDTLASSVLGFVDGEGKGVSGVEAYYNEILKGTDGIRYYRVDRDGNLLPTEDVFETAAVKGRDIELTIDFVLQNSIEKIANDALIENKAEKVSIIVMNPNTGEILAMANKPDYNLNDPFEGKSYDESADNWKNRAVNDSFEPGSIFKPFTAYAALESGVTTPYEMIDTKGYVNVLGTRINNWDKEARKNETMETALIKSSNTYFVEMARRMGKQKMKEYIDLFGFGKSTGVDMAGENLGIVKSLDSMSEVDLATIAFGQTNTLTMVQYMKAFNALVNGGYMVAPHILKSIESEDGSSMEYVKFEKEKVLNENITKDIVRMMQSVINKSKAYIGGYKIAGKTGTAQKPDYVNGGYKKGAYISSMAAAVPADNPQISIMISVDEPRGDRYYAGQIITPIAKRVVMETFSHLKDKNDTIMNVILNTVNMPDITSMTTEKAIEELEKNGLGYDIVGGGKYVSHTNIKVGELVEKGTVVKVITFD